MTHNLVDFEKEDIPEALIQYMELLLKRSN